MCVYGFSNAGTRLAMWRLTETRPFFVTSEFVGTMAALVALAVTAASSDSLDATHLWPLATAIVVAYAFSRGFGKAGASSRSWDPRETLGRSAAAADRRNVSDEEEETRMSTVPREEYEMRRGGAVAYGYGRGGMRQQQPVETKPFFLTSEFWASVAMLVGLAIAAGTDDAIDARRFWYLATAIVIGYVLSRGIAKSGTKSRAWDPREDLMESARERVSRQGQSG